VTEAPDPILVRRARIRRFVRAAQRLGYSALAVAVVVFIVGASSGFPGWSVAVTVGALAASIGVLPVPIVLGYGLRAAEREDAAQRRRTDRDAT
jgi:hypothetical protein